VRAVCRQNYTAFVCSRNCFEVIEVRFLRLLAYRNGTTNGTNNYGNNQSDSDVDDGADTAPSPSSIPLASSTSSPPYSPRSISKSSSGQIFFPSSENANSTEPNTSEFSRPVTVIACGS